jgi:hypothetical protein
MKMNRLYYFLATAAKDELLSRNKIFFDNTCNRLL